MRSIVGGRYSEHAKPDNDIPHYLRYHLENPGADVLIAAMKPAIKLEDGVIIEWTGPELPSPQADMDATREDTGDMG